VSHDLARDRADIAPVYDRGNDFYQWFLGEGMVYTSGIFRDPEESLEAPLVRVSAHRERADRFIVNAKIGAS
jgi:cyclopropane fatty-acyl-phospholipid synthase-like methyltransferase